LVGDLIAKALLPMEGVAKEPKFVQDAAVNRLAKLLTERDNSYKKVAGAEFDTCSEIVFGQLGVPDSPSGWTEAFPLVLSRAWSAVADKVTRELATLRV
jgi:hypothetical protein